MSEPMAFKSGKDLDPEAGTTLINTVSCVTCGRVETDERAYEEGWQFWPAVCPDCLRWTLTDLGQSCFGNAS